MGIDWRSENNINKYLFRAQKNKDERSQSIIKLNDSTLLYYKEIER